MFKTNFFAISYSLSENHALQVFFATHAGGFSARHLSHLASILKEDLGRLASLHKVRIRPMVGTAVTSEVPS